MSFKLIECPRDAMQGLHQFISTDKKISYINDLLKVGFDTLDFGSFVSPRAIPQMRDSSEVLEKLDLSGKTKLLAIVANEQGADEACSKPGISYLGFPFSVSETFQLRNTNSTIDMAVKRLEYIQDLCIGSGKKLVVYISMGFGNPYGDPWNADIVNHWVEKIKGMGVEIISLSDTVGVANPQSISYLFTNLIAEYPGIEFGAHLHTRPESWKEKMEAASNSGCLRFDGAIKGYGGCPMAMDDLTGNMPTENILSFMKEKDLKTGIDMEAFDKALIHATELFNSHS